MTNVVALLTVLVASIVIAQEESLKLKYASLVSTDIA